MKPSFILNSMALALLCLASAQGHADNPSVLFVLDGSGSMWARIGEKPKIDIAKTVMTDMLRNLAPEVRAGLMVYGHTRKDDCADIAVVAPVGSDRATVVRALHDVSPKGKTPLTGAIQLAAAQLKQVEGSASVVVVSDGEETCEGDPCAAAREAAEKGVNLRIHVVGFDVSQEETEQLNCIAREGRGKYFSAANAEQLVVALAEVQKEVQETVAPPPPAPVQVEQAPPPPPEPVAEVLFEDRFDRDELGEMWEVLNPDPNRLALSDNKLLIVGTRGKKNIALVQRPLSTNFTVTIKVDSQVGQDNWIGLQYWVDEKNYLRFGPQGYCCSPRARLPAFEKMAGGSGNAIRPRTAIDLGNRSLQGYATESETWYLQLERSGVKYIARISVDGQDWSEIGTHTFLPKDGRIGVFADAGHGIEHAAEFDDLVVRGAQ